MINWRGQKHGGDEHERMSSLGRRRKKARIATTARGPRTEEVPPRSAWDALPDEVICLVLEACTQRDISTLAQTCRRMRRLCMDDALWRRVYLRDFPPCREACLWLLGNEVDRLPVSLLDHVQRRLGRVLDRDDDLSALDPVDARVAQSIEHLTGGSVEGVSRCVHHWPAVIQARGYRWACASMVALDGGGAVTRRPFHANYAPGASGAIVGSCAVQAPHTYDSKGRGDREDDWTDDGAIYPAAYRGEVAVRGGGFVAHGAGTLTSRADHRRQWMCRSGLWKHAKAHRARGPCAWWQSVHGRHDGAAFVHCSGADRVPHLVEGFRVTMCNTGVLLMPSGDIAAVGCLSHAHADTDPRKGATRLALIACSGTPGRCQGTVTAMTTDLSLRVIANHIGSKGCWTALCADGQGLVRTPGRRVAFAGWLHRCCPQSGSAWSVDGHLLYDGLFEREETDSGTFYRSDGTTLACSWARARRDDLRAFEPVTMVHPDGATVVWREWRDVDGHMRPRVFDFFWAPSGTDAAATERPWPCSTWDVVVLPREPGALPEAPMCPLLADAGMPVAGSLCVPPIYEILADLAFWPRPNGAGGKRPHLADTFAFVSRMAATRPRWVRCARIVSALYGPL